jgi:hypothetical protein
MARYDGGRVRAFIIKGLMVVPPALAALIMGWATWSTLPQTQPDSTGAAAATLATPTRVPRLRVALIESGLTIDALCAAGVQPSQVAQVVADARAYAVANPTGLRDARTALTSARQALDRAERCVSTGAAPDETIAAVPQLRQAAAAAQANMDAACANVINAATASLSDGQRALLAQIRANRHVDLPVQYKVVDRTPAEWSSLKRAVRAGQVLARTGGQLAPAAQAQLSGADGQAAVAAAAANMTQNGPALRAAWRAALAQ